MTSHVRRVVVLTANVGEGHLAAARVVADDLRDASPGIEVTTIDALEVLGPVLRVLLRDAYRLQLRRTPWIFALLFGLFLRVRPLRGIGRLALATFGAHRMEKALSALQPDLVVSTYPAATSVLGSLRRRRRLDVVACATITDLGGVPFWAHRGIDLHLVMHPALVPLVEREAGMHSARAVAPLVDTSFRMAPDRSGARRALQLPERGRVVVVSGGGWGVGDLAGATEEAARIPGAIVICLTGRNTQLHEALTSSFAGQAHVRVVGFTERMERVLAAADVVVHTTGGVTCLEALTIGCPIVAFGPPAGHAPTLARSMAQLGIAVHARNRKELRAALLAPTPAPTLDASSPAAATQLLQARLRRPDAASPLARVKTPLAVATAAAAAFLALGSRSAFAVFAYPFHLAPQSVLPTNGPDIGLVVEATPAGAAAVERILAAHGERASLAFTHAPAPAARESLEARHDQVIGILGGSGLDDWLGTDDEVPGGGGNHLVLVAKSGISTGQYILARVAGAHLVTPASHIRPGAIVVCDQASVARLLALLDRRGLRAEPVGTLTQLQR